jgi:hypothetical protein
MHDWGLISLLFDWKTGRATLSFETYEQGIVLLVAEGVSDLHIPQLKEWGPSVSVNEVRGPFGDMNDLAKLEIEMQSGDVIRIEAISFNFPPGINGEAEES